MSVAETSIAVVSAVASVASAIWAFSSARTSTKQLALVTRQVKIVTDPAKLSQLLPAWYVDRMANDVWGFGLLLASGEIIAINQIVGVSDDGKWLEVKLDDGSYSPNEWQGIPVITGFADRPNATIKVDQIQAAFEIATS